MLAGELHRSALEQAELVLAGQFAEGDHRTGEGDGTDGRAEEQLQAVAGRDGVAQVLHDAQRLRLDDGGDGDEHGGQTDHAVHEGDQFRHLGHFDALGHDRTGGAADQQADHHVGQAAGGVAAFTQLGGQLEHQEHGGDDGDRHADHAEGVALARRGRVGQALERLDEAHRGDQVEEGNQVHAHVSVSPPEPSGLSS
ncbi:hypothetical protein D9M69_448210 [compost metagenome]